MKIPALYPVLLFTLMCPCAFGQSIAMDRAEVLGRLAVGYSPSYIAHLVKKRGVSFDSSGDFLYRIKLGGGDGVLYERLSSAEVRQQPSLPTNAEPSYEHLGKCAEQVHIGNMEAAEKECRAAIEENPKSAWPLLVTARVLERMGEEISPEAAEENKEKRAELLRHAAALAPNLASVHQALAAILPAKDAMAELQKGFPDTEQLEISELHSGGCSDTYGLSPQAFSFDAGADNPEAPANETITVNSESQRRMQIDPDLASAHLVMAFQYKQARHFDKAESELREAMRLEPDNVMLHESLGVLSFSRHRTEEALGELEACVQIAPYGIQSRMVLAGVLELLGRTPEAVAELQKITGLYPAAAQPSEALIDLYIEHKNRTAAIAELRRSLKAASLAYGDQDKFMEARFTDLGRLALLLKENREFEAAAEQYVYLLRYQPDSADLHNDYGNVLLAEQRIDEALDEYNEALLLAPNMAPAHNNVGLCLALKKNFEGAITELRRALDINPDEPHSQTYLGMALGQQGDLDGARKQFKEAIEKNPKDAGAHTSLAYALAQLRDEAGAVEELKLALQLEPDSAEAENDLAWLYATAEDRKLRNPAEALRLARRAVEGSPTPVPAFIDTLAEALLLNRQPGEALAAEQQAAALDPKNPELQKRLVYFRESVLLAAAPKP